jgi:hypothetical protein
MAETLSKVYIYKHPEWPNFLFSPCLLRGTCQYIIVEGYDDDQLNERFSHEKNDEGWYAGIDTYNFVMARLDEARKRLKA